MTVEVIPFEAGESIRVNGEEFMWIENGHETTAQDIAYAIDRMFVDFEDIKDELDDETTGT